MAKLLTFSARDFEWNGQCGSSNLNKLGISQFPTNGFYLKSPKTGKVILFLYDTDRNELNEFYDGECAAFFSPSNQILVHIWTGQ